MKKTLLLVGMLVVTGLVAQEHTPKEVDKPRGPGPGRHHRPPPPLIVALDANRDGEIDAQEIANAGNALLKLDRNGDGHLSLEELRPPCPGGHPRGEHPPRGERPGR